jgi:catalase
VSVNSDKRGDVEMGKSKKLTTAFGNPVGDDQNPMTDVDCEHLIGNIVTHLGGAQKRIQLRQTALFHKADPEYGQRVAEGLGLDPKQIEK